MSDQENTATAREVWLMVALAVARDGLPAPKRFSIYDEHRSLTVHCDNYKDADAWGAWLGAVETAHWREFGHASGAVRNVYYESKRRGGPGGWSWEISGSEPIPTIEASDLADEVAAAITVRQTPAPATKIWACPECTYRIADGPHSDDEVSTDDLITEHLEEHADLGHALAEIAAAIVGGARSPVAVMVPDNADEDGSCNVDPDCAQHWGHRGECERVLGRHPELGLI